MQVQTSSTSGQFYPSSVQGQTEQANLAREKSLVQININQGFGVQGSGGNCVCESKRPSPKPVPDNSEVNFQSLFDQLKSVMNEFFTDIKAMVQQSLSDIKDIISGAFGVTKAAEGSKPPVTGTPPVSDKPVNTPNALSWNDKALEYLRPGSSGQVTEGELQEGLVMFQIYEKSIPAKTLFRQELENAKSSSSAVQANIKSSLMKVVEAGLLSKEDAEKIYSVSHRAAKWMIQ